MNSPRTKNKTLDLNKVREIIFDDIDPLLETFGLEYEQVADNIFMRCPIHEGSDNPQAVSISLSKNAWRCWTRGCHDEFGTDIFSFIRGLLYAKGESHEFSDALRKVCEIYNVNNAQARVEKKQKPREDSFLDLVKTFRKTDNRSTLVTPEFFKVNTLGNSPYFEGRGFRRGTLSHFGVEDCSNNKSAMRHRSIIPITQRGKQVGYIARSTKDWLQPKYLFSEGIRKTDYLYNYDEAIKVANEKHCLFLVEGQGDVWRLYEAGVRNVVGLFGKDISTTQRSLLLKSGVTSLVVLTDNDQAGRESKIKINRELGRLFNLFFPVTYGKDLGDTSVEKIRAEILINLRGHY
jgi:5S rRNA maturation endonuclease (ribonuclease M5)